MSADAELECAPDAPERDLELTTALLENAGQPRLVRDTGIEPKGEYRPHLHHVLHHPLVRPEILLAGLDALVVIADHSERGLVADHPQASASQPEAVGARRRLGDRVDVEHGQTALESSAVPRPLSDTPSSRSIVSTDATIARKPT